MIEADAANGGHCYECELPVRPRSWRGWRVAMEATFTFTDYNGVGQDFFGASFDGKQGKAPHRGSSCRTARCSTSGGGQMAQWASLGRTFFASVEGPGRKQRRTGNSGRAAFAAHAAPDHSVRSSERSRGRNELFASYARDVVSESRTAVISRCRWVAPCICS